jgi:protein TonB
MVEPAPPAGPTEVVLPTPQPRERVEQEAAPPQRTTPSDARPPATQAAAGGGRASAARIATWRSALALRLAHAKRYPADAQARQQQGVAKVRFTLDARGHVLTRALVDSSGIASLDAESLAMIERAQPFPAPPSGISSPVEVVVPIRFSFR